MNIEQKCTPTFIVSVDSHSIARLFDFIYSLLGQNFYHWQCIFLTSPATDKENIAIIKEYCFLDKRFIHIMLNQSELQSMELKPPKPVLDKLKGLYYAYVEINKLFASNAANEIYHYILHHSAYSQIIINSKKLSMPGYYYSINCIHTGLDKNIDNLSNTLILRNISKVDKITLGFIDKSLYLI